MRVLITVPSLLQDFGGPAGKAPRLRDALRARGHDVELAGCAPGPSAEGEIRLAPLGRFHASPIPRTLRTLREAVRSADIVHILGYRDPVGTGAALAARRHGVPYVLEPVGMHRRRLRSVGIKAAFDTTVGRAVVGGAAALVATSVLERSELVADGVSPERVVVRANGIDLPSVLLLSPRGALRSRLRIPPAAPVILALGRITMKKGLVDLAEAISRLPGVWGLVAGPDEDDGALGALLAARQRLGLSARLLVVTGGFWGAEKVEAFTDADVFCLPSATENFAIAAAEAAAAGLPVVVSDQCGVSEWLDPAASRIVPYGDVGALTKALEQLLAEPARAAARAAAPGLRQALDWGTLAAQQAEIYEVLLADLPVGGPTVPVVNVSATAGRPLPQATGVTNGSPPALSCSRLPASPSEGRHPR